MKVTVDVPLELLHIIKDTVRGNIQCDKESIELDPIFAQTAKFWLHVRFRIEQAQKAARKAKKGGGA